MWCIHKPSWRRVFAYLFSLFVVLAAGCSDSTKLKDVDSITPELDTANKVTEAIGPAGGSVITTDANGLLYTLDVPPGVLPYDIDVSMTPVVDIPDLHGADKFHVGVQFGPDGLLMVEPAILTIDLPEKAKIRRLLGVGWDGTGEDAYLEPILSVGGQIRFPVTHFSGTGVIEGDGNDIADALLEDESLEKIFKEKLSIMAQEEWAKVCPTNNDCEEDPAIVHAFSEAMFPRAIDLLFEWFEAISPQLQAGSRPEHAKRLLVDFFTWEALAIKTLCGLFDGDCSEFSDNFSTRRELLRLELAQALLLDFEKYFAACNDFDTFEMLELAALIAGSNENSLAPQFRTLLGVDNETDVYSELRKRFACHLKVELLGFPDSFAQGEDPVDFDVQISNPTSATNAPLEDKQLQISTGGLGCGVIDGPADHVTDANGRVPGVSVSAANCVDPATDKVVVYVSVNDSINVVELDQFFIGRSVRFEAGVTDPCAGAALKSTGRTFAQVLAAAADSCGGIVISILPVSGSVTAGNTLQFSATVTGAADTSVTWSATGGVVDPTGLFTAGNVAGTFTVTATSVADPASSSSVTVLISEPPVNISYSYEGVRMELDFSACLMTSYGECAWENLSVGRDDSWPTNEYQLLFHTYRINNTKVWYTITVSGGNFDGVMNPNQCPTGRDCWIRGTLASDGDAVILQGRRSNEDAACRGYNDCVVHAFRVRSSDHPGNSASITVTPIDSTVAPGETVQFSADVTGLAVSTVNWSADGGAIDTTGLYTAGDTTGTFVITAVSQQDSSYAGSTTITVTP